VPGQETDDEAEGHADQHQTEGRPREDLREPGHAGVEEVGDGRAPFSEGCYHVAPRAPGCC